MMRRGRRTRRLWGRWHRPLWQTRSQPSRHSAPEGTRSGALPSMLVTAKTRGAQ